MLNLVEGAGDLARRVDAGAAGVVRLGFTAVSAISILGPLLRRLTVELPDVEVRLSERVTLAQVDGIRRGELDIGLARPPFDTALLSSRVMLREPLMAVLPAIAPAGRARPAAHPAGLRGRARHRLPPRAVALLPRALRALPRQRPPAHRPARAPGAHRDAARLRRAWHRPRPGLGRVPPRRRRGLQELAHDGGDTRLDADPERPVELHAIWSRASVTPVVRRVLEVVAPR